MTPFYADAAVTIYNGDCTTVLQQLEPGCARTCITSPPYYGLRDYGHAGQIGLEETPEDYVDRLVEVFREVRRCLAADGTLWLNLGDSYSGSGKGGNPGHSPHQKQRTNRGSLRRLTPVPSGLKAKELIGIPWRVAFALQADGWFLRQDLIWHKPNPMPESVGDRCTKAHEYIFLLSKSARYFWDRKAMQEPATWERPNGLAKSPYGQGFARAYPSPEALPEGRMPHSGNRRRKPGGERGVPGASSETSAGSVASGIPWEGVTRNKRSVWSVVTQPYKAAHFATFPPKLIEPCVLAGSAPGDLVLDPFGGAGTTALVAKENFRRAVIAELNPEYAELAADRVAQQVLMLGGGQFVVLMLVPTSLREANEYVRRHHRHHQPVRGHKFAIAVAEGEQIVGVAIIGRPRAKALQDGWTLEVNRCTTDGTRNACSFLYGAAWRAARALGFRRLITYTLPEEGGASLRAAGWKEIGRAGGGSWNRTNRPRVDMHPQQAKLRWEAEV